MDKIPIGIIGVGMVGGAYQRWFESQGHRVFPFDLYKGVGTMDAANGAEIVFIAVPTPFDEKRGRFDLSEVEKAAAAVAGSKIIVIKSTVLPGTTESLQERHPHHRFLFSPEFLTESTADADVTHPAMHVVGYTDPSRGAAPEIMSLFARAPFERIMPSREAEFFKYLRNTFFATKVIFFNQMYDLCVKLSLDYETIRECAAHDPWIGGQHTAVWHKDYRGYGGKCLPKDTKALISFSADNGVRQELLERVEEINQKLNVIKGN